MAKSGKKYFPFFFFSRLRPKEEKKKS